MIISHPGKDDISDKPLIDHSLNVANNSKTHISNMRLNTSIITKKLLSELSFIIGIFHDFGKVTSFFQEYIRGQRNKSPLTRHGFISAVICYYVVLEKTNSKLLSIISYMVVKKHHGNLEKFKSSESDNINIFENQIEDILDKNIEDVKEIFSDFVDIEQIMRNINNLDETLNDIEDFMDDEYFDEYSDEQKIECYFIVNLLFSVLIDSDKKDAARLTTDYFNGNLNEPINDIFSFVENCRKEDPEKFNPNKEINKVRDEFLKDIQNNDQIRKENHFYTITAPTGIGKTFGCLAFANKLKEQLDDNEGRIIYCLPYTSIIDQNFDEFENIIMFNKNNKYENKPTRYLLKHHYLSMKKVNNRINSDDYTYKDYLDDKLFVESWESSMIVTTFVQFFHTIIGYENSFLKKFHNIVNSIVILDEIQNINPSYYYLLQKIFDVLGKRFNIYFLFITATQPLILDNKISKPISIIDSKKYMGHKLFNRVILKIMKQNQSLEDFKNYFCDNFTEENCLLVLNTKKSAVSLFKYIKENKRDYNVFCLTTYIIPRDRRNKIKQIKKLLKDNKKIIVVSTQLIEAGVDVSFKYVYRDFGPLDSIIQVAGRCNRNGEYGILGGVLTLIKLTDDHNNLYHSYIYKPIISQYVNQTFKEITYESKDFYDLSKDYFNKFEFKYESKMLINAISDLNYDKQIGDQIPVSDFKLIEEYDEENIYILITKDAQQDMDRFLKCKNSIYDKNIHKKEKEVYLLEIEKLKNSLKDYQINLKKSDLKEYNNTNIIIEENYFKYISYNMQKKYVYDEDIGFLSESKKSINITINF